MNIPLYVQVKQRITEELVSGKWRAGDMIPSEIVLANDFKVSQGTVRKAIDALSNEKILVTLLSLQVFKLRTQWVV